jgi:hypothetical protein
MLNDREILSDIAAGYESAAYAETFVMEGLKPDVEKFHANDRDETTMRRLRVYNEARGNFERMVREAAAIRHALAELPETFA